MLSVMSKKWNEVISNTQIFKEHNLLTKKIFEDCVEFIISKGYNHNIRPAKTNGIIIQKDRVASTDELVNETQL